MGDLFGKYELVERIGIGGMAEVFLARLSGPAGFSKTLVVKRIQPLFTIDPEFVSMFHREAALAAMLDHANIVRIYEHDQVGSIPYIAMEYVDGLDLRELLRRAQARGRALTVPELAIIGIETARGLAFAHAERRPGAPVVIHRDLSPHNLMLSRAGEVKIADFGIAKIAGETRATQTGTTKGKLGYMSPEQARGTELDPRSDLFSLGCVLWELLCGQKLFSGPNELAILDALKNRPIPSPSGLNPAVPAALDDLVLACLERDRDKRIQTASRLEQGLEEVLRQFPAQNRSETLSRLCQEMIEDRTGERTETMPVAEGHGRGQGQGQGMKAQERAAQQSQASSVAESKAEDRPRRPSRPITIIAASAAAFVAIVAVVLAWPTSPEGLAGPAVTTDQPNDSPAPAPGSAEGPPPASAAPAEGLATPTSAAQGGLAAPAEPVKAGSSPPLSGALDAAPATQKVKYGWLSLDCRPWAEVYLGDRKLGDTPLERVRLPAGKHRLRIVNKAQGLERNVTVSIASGGHSRESVRL